MTGGLGLLGNVERIGGVQQKLEAAHVGGFTRVIFPASNKEELEAAVAKLWPNSLSFSSGYQGAHDTITVIIDVKDALISTDGPIIIRLHLVRHVLDIMAIVISGE